jgi:hypothetical protein
MDYELAKQVKEAGFRREVYSIGDRFYEFDVLTNEPFLQYVSEWYLRAEQFEQLKTKPRRKATHSSMSSSRVGTNGL